MCRFFSFLVVSVTVLVLVVNNMNNAVYTEANQMKRTNEVNNVNNAVYTEANQMKKTNEVTKPLLLDQTLDHNTAVELFRAFMLQPPTPAKVPYEGFDTSRTYFSQVGQDEAIDKILNGKRDGFFIEVGAYNGVDFSNSLLFEKSRGWTGLLIEANPRAYRELLAKDRKAWNTPACISLSDKVDIGVDFLAHGMIGKVNGDSSAKDLANPYVYKVKANCFPLNVMLDAIGVAHVDMFSLDVEGVELQVLKSIDWSRITVSLLTIEKNGAEAAIDEFLTSKGYRKLSSQQGQKWSGSDVMYLHESVHI
jgi:hypothetical protein